MIDCVRALRGGACITTFVVVSALAPLLVVTSAQQQTSVPTQTLPGGASQVQETHGDWRVICAQQDNKRVCVFSQQIADKGSRQLVLGVACRSAAS